MKVRRRVRFDNPCRPRIVRSMRPPTKVFLLALVSGVCSVHAQTTPAKLATSARLDLFAEQGAGLLTSAEIPIGAGNVERMNWVPETDRVRSYTVHFPITDRKSTRLNSSHITISYAVFCLKKKKGYT